MTRAWARPSALLRAAAAAASASGAGFHPAPGHQGLMDREGKRQGSVTREARQCLHTSCTAAWQESIAVIGPR